VAISVVVPSSDEDDDSQAVVNSSIQTDIDVSAQTGNGPSTEGTIAATGLQIIQGSYQARGVSQQLFPTLLAARPESSTNQYASYLCQWKDYCDKEQLVSIDQTWTKY